MTTTIVLHRHAQSESGTLLDDSTRTISPEGRLTEKKMAALLQREGYIPDRILYSPFVRTEQTAKILGDFFNIKIEKEPALSINFDETSLLQKIPDPALGLTIFMVSHGPVILEFANSLLGKGCGLGIIPCSSAIVLAFKDEVNFGKATLLHCYMSNSMN